jgi:hypothetical protein
MRKASAHYATHARMPPLIGIISHCLVNYSRFASLRIF